VFLFVRGLVLAALASTFVMPPSPAHAASVNEALASAVNSYRASRGLPTVTISPTLQAAAQFMADDVARYGPPAIPHRSSDGRTARQRMADAGYPIGSAFTSEIVAWGSSTATGAMRMWLNSPPHWAELNDGRYVAAGFGVACYGVYPCVWVVTFGSLLDRAPTPPPSYHAAFSTQSAYPVAAPGQLVQWVVAFRNTGASSWSVDGANPLRLGTGRPLDAASALASTRWITANRPAQQTTATVAPGQDAWFIVELVAPSTPGTYRLYVRPVIDGALWLEDAGAYVDLVVR
jgi:uncharacterized protein YkwD